MKRARLKPIVNVMLGIVLIVSLFPTVAIADTEALSLENASGTTVLDASAKTASDGQSQKVISSDVAAGSAGASADAAVSAGSKLLGGVF